MGAIFYNVPPGDVGGVGNGDADVNTWFWAGGGRGFNRGLALLRPFNWCHCLAPGSCTLDKPNVESLLLRENQKQKALDDAKTRLCTHIHTNNTPTHARSLTHTHTDRKTNSSPDQRAPLMQFGDE